MTPTVWTLAHGRELALGAEARIMGILNVTPDSFSDGGRYAGVEEAVAEAERMAAEGAAIIDVGGESTRPGGAPVDAREEQRRVLPVIEALAARRDMLVSVDTYREETARLALKAGAHIVNDIWGLQREPGIARLAAETGAGLVVMHNGRERERLADVVADQLAFLGTSLAIAAEAGVVHGQIVLDPGFGFAKEVEDNLALMARFEELHALGHPLMAGTSRKRFVGAVTGREASARDAATAATSVVLRLKGAALFRVHDVAANVEALKIADAVLAHRPEMRNRAEKGATRAFLGLGGNVGEPRRTMAAALRRIDADPKTTVLAVSSLYRTKPWGLAEQPDFLNAVAEIETLHPPEALLALCLSVETGLKRVRRVRWGPRAIDIDILLYGGETVRREGLEIPHPRMAERAFVMVPLAEIAPQADIFGVPARERAAALGGEGIVAVAGRDWWKEEA